MTIDSKIAELAVLLGDAFQSYEQTAQTLADDAQASAASAADDATAAQSSRIASETAATIAQAAADAAAASASVFFDTVAEAKANTTWVDGRTYNIAGVDYTWTNASIATAIAFGDPRYLAPNSDSTGASGGLVVTGSINASWAPGQWGSLAGALHNGPVSHSWTRTGGYGTYGLGLLGLLVTDATPSGEFDVALTAWNRHTNLTGGTVFGGWVGANSPSQELGHTWSSGYAVGQEINCGNLWSDFGLLADTAGAGRATIGIKIVADEIPSPAGETTAVYPGSFAAVVGRSNRGHRWWTGYFTREDSIMPGGYAARLSGGSVSVNALAAGLRIDGYHNRGIDMSGLLGEQQAIILPASGKISWGGAYMLGTSSIIAITTGAGTGEGRLSANGDTNIALRWSSSGSAPRIGFYNTTPVVQPTIAAAATDLATAITLVNSIRTILIQNGLAKA